MRKGAAGSGRFIVDEDDSHLLVADLKDLLQRGNDH